MEPLQLVGIGGRAIHLGSVDRVSWKASIEVQKMGTCHRDGRRTEDVSKAVRHVQSEKRFQRYRDVSI